MLSKDQYEVKSILDKLHINKSLPLTEEINSVEKWVSFLFPKETKDIYLFLHQNMLQTPTWFNQGNINLKTGQNRVIPFFRSFMNLSKHGSMIGNNQLKLDLTTGKATTNIGTSFDFSEILTFDGKEEIITKIKPNVNPNLSKYVFYWNKETKFGAIISKDVS